MYAKPTKLEKKTTKWNEFLFVDALSTEESMLKVIT